MLSHPQPLLEAFWGFQFSQEILEKFNIPQIDTDAKRAILGENYARATGLNITERRNRIKGDIFERTVSADGLRAPYSTWQSGERIGS